MKSNTRQKSVKPLTLKLADFPESTLKSTGNDINKAFHQKVFTLFASGESEVYTMSKRFPLHYDHCIVFVENDQGPYFLSGNGAERIRRWIQSDINTGAKETSSLYEIWQKDFMAFKVACARLDKMELVILPAEKLYK